MDLCGVHPALSIEKEYPPGMPDRDVYTIAGRDGETAVGYAVVQGEYKVSVNIAARRREEGWRIRGLLAAWAMASGQDTGEIEPTHWPGVAYDGIVKSISTPEFVFGFAKVEVIFLVPRPYAHDLAYTSATGQGKATLSIGGSAACRPRVVFFAYPGPGMRPPGDYPDDGGGAQRRDVDARRVGGAAYKRRAFCGAKARRGFRNRRGDAGWRAYRKPPRCGQKQLFGGFQAGGTWTDQRRRRQPDGKVAMRMGVTVYIFDANRRIRRVLPDVTELLHTESDGTLEAVFPQTAGATPGEELGFACVDGLFRLFTIDSVEHDDHNGTAIVTATDAARAELQDTVTLNVELESATAIEAARQILTGRGWRIEGGGGRSEKVATGYTSAWAALSDLESTHEVRVLPGYAISGGVVMGRRLVVTERTSTFRGRIFEARLDATDIAITHSERPITRAYGVGAATGTQDVPTRMTIADAAWSRANGDPADKPAGQAYIDNPDAPPGALVREMMVLDENETDAVRLLEKTWEKLKARQTAHVSGTATVADVEMQPGMEYKAVRLYDRVAVIARSGEKVMATVLEIKRDYVRPHLTKITIGEEDFQPRTLSKAVAALARSEIASRGRSAGANNKIIQNAALIQLNAEAIQMNAGRGYQAARDQGGGRAAGRPAEQKDQRGFHRPECGERADQAQGRSNGDGCTRSARFRSGNRHRRREQQDHAQGGQDRPRRAHHQGQRADDGRREGEIALHRKADRHQQLCAYRRKGRLVEDIHRRHGFHASVGRVGPFG